MALLLRHISARVRRVVLVRRVTDVRSSDAHCWHVRAYEGCPAREAASESARRRRAGARVSRVVGLFGVLRGAVVQLALASDGWLWSCA